MKKDCVFGPDGKYRYVLSRVWDEELPFVMFIGLNPSTADNENDDPTIRKLITYCKSWGYGGFYITNLFAYVSSDPKVLKSIPNPVGVMNDSYIIGFSEHCKMVVCMWGNKGTLYNRDVYVIHLLIQTKKLYCFETSVHGNPKHPLYLKADLKPCEFVIKSLGTPITTIIN